jgi:hypothetical protein
MNLNREEFNCGFDCGFDKGIDSEITHTIHTTHTTQENLDYTYNGAIIFPSQDGTKIFESKGCVVIDYRSLYPEPFEEVLYKYNLNLETFFKYRSEYNLVNRLFNEKVTGYDFFVIRPELTSIIHNILETEKINLFSN